MNRKLCRNLKKIIFSLLNHRCAVVENPGCLRFFVKCCGCKIMFQLETFWGSENILMEKSEKMSQRVGSFFNLSPPPLLHPYFYANLVQCFSLNIYFKQSKRCRRLNGCVASKHRLNKMIHRTIKEEVSNL